MRFKYLAFSASGQPVSGVLEVDSPQAAEAALWNSDLVVVEIKQERSSLSLAELFPSLFGGGQYKLYTYRKYSDVRLVWAPQWTPEMMSPEAKKTELRKRIQSGEYESSRAAIVAPMSIGRRACGLSVS